MSEPAAFTVAQPRTCAGKPLVVITCTHCRKQYHASNAHPVGVTLSCECGGVRWVGANERNP